MISYTEESLTQEVVFFVSSANRWRVDNDRTREQLGSKFESFEHFTDHIAPIKNIIIKTFHPNLVQNFNEAAEYYSRFQKASVEEKKILKESSQHSNSIKIRRDVLDRALKEFKKLRNLLYPDQQLPPQSELEESSAQPSAQQLPPQSELEESSAQPSAQQLPPPSELEESSAQPSAQQLPPPSELEESSAQPSVRRYTANTSRKEIVQRLSPQQQTDGRISRFNKRDHVEVDEHRTQEDNKKQRQRMVHQLSRTKVVHERIRTDIKVYHDRGVASYKDFLMCQQKEEELELEDRKNSEKAAQFAVNINEFDLR